MKNKGFTIVELLIVVVLIAILAAITIVAYNGLQKRAQTSAVSTALNQASKKVKLYQVDNNAYPTTLATAGVTDSGVTYQYTGSATTFCITGTQGSTSLYLSDTVTRPTEGGCAGHGQGGVAAVTNLATNPSAFSSTTGWSAWGGNGGGVVSSSSVAAGWATRGRAARGTWTTANTTLYGDIGWQVSSSGGASSLEPNTQYTASWKVSASKSQKLAANAGNWAALGAASGTGTGVINSTSGIATTTPGSGVSQSITFTTGANTYGAKIYAAPTTGATTWNVGDYIEMSDFMLTKGNTVRPYADGSSPNWVWNGGANASTSTGPAL